MVLSNGCRHQRGDGEFELAADFADRKPLSADFPAPLLSTGTSRVHPRIERSRLPSSKDEKDLASSSRLSQR